MFVLPIGYERAMGYKSHNCICIKGLGRKAVPGNIEGFCRWKLPSEVGSFEKLNSLSSW